MLWDFLIFRTDTEVDGKEIDAEQIVHMRKLNQCDHHKSFILIFMEWIVKERPVVGMFYLKFSARTQQKCE